MAATSGSSATAAAAAPVGPRRGEGKVCLLTGASAGLGKVAAHRLAAEGFHLFLACRNEAKTQPVIAEIKAATGNANVEFLPLDLESLASARRCAELFLARGLPLHLLVNNAGLSDSGLTGDGFERQFQVNYLGHFLLTVLLLDRLRASAPARIIMVGSQVYMLSGGVDADAVRRKCTWGLGIFGYAASKLAMVWAMQELKRRLDGTGVVVHTVHPGGVWTDIYAPWAPPIQWLIRLVAVTPEAAVDTILNPALLPEHGTPEASGRYFQELAVYPINATGSDLARARAFWDQSEVWAGLAPAAPSS